MSRTARFVVDNGFYHVMNRGNDKKEIFKEKKDYEYFLELLKSTKEKYDIKIYHYVLMYNHFHLILKAKTGKDLSDSMQRITMMYTQYYRKHYEGVGHFFQDRFKSFIIQEGHYLLECSRYVELNPVKAGIVEDAKDYKWSSYKSYIEGGESEFLDSNPEFEGLSDDIEKGRQIYKEFIKDGTGWERRKEDRFFKSGVYGSKEFIGSLKKDGLTTVWSHRGRPRT